eukprot:TRINITY_DN157_c2_g1_i1.p1 TRINITY_DN157_c2_g1~~TRINITY_DN157_c2_g1_i1.p1  ORF type:complete len:365 (-),score=96.18 TRINITY_DN157_c2_g1_i1:129-1223(-)
MHAPSDHESPHIHTEELKGYDLKVIEARGLRITPGRLNALVTINFKGKSKQRSKITKEDTPQWDQTFRLQPKSNEEMVQIRVFQKHFFHRVLLGMTELHLAPLRHILDEWIPIHKGREKTGEIHVIIVPRAHPHHFVSPPGEVDNWNPDEQMSLKSTKYSNARAGSHDTLLPGLPYTNTIVEEPKTRRESLGDYASSPKDARFHHSDEDVLSTSLHHADRFPESDKPELVWEGKMPLTDVQIERFPEKFANLKNGVVQHPQDLVSKSSNVENDLSKEKFILHFTSPQYARRNLQLENQLEKSPERKSPSKSPFWNIRRASMGVTSPSKKKDFQVENSSPNLNKLTRGTPVENLWKPKDRDSVSF